MRTKYLSCSLQDCLSDNFSALCTLNDTSPTFSGTFRYPAFIPTGICP
jgi:hypothetical protein